MLKQLRRDVVQQKSHIQDQLLEQLLKLFKRGELKSLRLGMRPEKQLFGTYSLNLLPQPMLVRLFPSLIFFHYIILF